MELYHNNMSVCAQKVRVVLAEKDLKPLEHHLNLRAGESHTPEYLKLNPKGVVPTLIDNGEPIIESTVICEYLDDVGPGPALRPDNPIKRAKMRKWTMIPDTGLHKACAMVTFAIAFRHQEQSKQLAALGPADREARIERNRLGLDAPGAAEAVMHHVQVLDDMARQLDKTPWLAGDQFSLADTAVLPYVIRLEQLMQSWLWEKGKRAAVGDWLARCKARKGFAGIAAYIDPKYIELMTPTGNEARPKVEAIVARGT
ncbi:MAG: glutathione S-transferase family protein [Rhizobiales bacterium]|nr:glutathione S-transferase family protein [Hyphomicrobiales bacterium]